MARNYVPLSQVVDDFIITLESDDYANTASDNIVRTYALRGIREMGFDFLKVIRSLKLSVDTSNNTVTLPDDYVDWTKVGVVGSDGLIYVLGENKNLNYSQIYTTDAAGNTSDSDGDGLLDREDSKSATSGNAGGATTLSDSYSFNNYLHNNDIGTLYGAGGGNYHGEFRVNLDQNRLELKGNNSMSQVVIEYVADEGRATNPRVHAYAEEALRSYMYYKLVERKSSVPAGEKARARAEYYNERRKANARMKSVTKEEILKTIRKNFKQAPKR
mgnify:CR=1 FL=1|tara:strand:+ start:729 stop:1547 length:819 start_codon:yes stop_codon:yes gene_type:complete